MLDASASRRCSFAANTALFAVCVEARFRMRSLAVLSLLFVLALASCGGRERVANSNSTEPLARPATELSGRQCVNLNTASAEELERLPGIGEMTARKIIEYRVQNGPFRRPEEIIIIEGFSERKYRAIADLVCVN
jgi:competence ComEA-like helix-hairpin-helix protein